MTVDMPCVCTDPKSEHAGLAYACWACGCQKYTPDIQAGAEAIKAKQERDEDRDRHRILWNLERDAQVKLRQRKVAAEAELASARTELEQLRATLQNTATAYLGTTTAATQGVISQLTRYLCETCGARYGQPFTDHEHGPLTPVTVTVARQA